MKKLLSTLMLLILSALYHSTSLAQYEPSSQLGLPEGAIARLNKGNIHDITYSPDGSQVAVTTLSGVWIYDVNAAKAVKLLTGQHIGRVINATYSPDGKTLATVSFDKTVRIWDVYTEKITKILKGHAYIVHTVTYSPDGNILATGDIDKKIRLWNPHTGKNLKTFKKNVESFNSIGFTSNGNTIVSAETDGPVQFWDVNNGRLLRTLNQYGTPIAFSPKGDTVILTVKKMENSEDSKDSSNAIIGTEDDSKDTVCMINVATGQPIQTFSTHYRVTALEYSSDGKMIATVGSGGVQLWNATTAKLMKTLFDKKQGVNCISFSPDSKTVAIGCTDGTMQWCDVKSGTNFRTFTGYMEAYTGPLVESEPIKYSTDGKIIGITDSRDINLWNVNTGEHLRTLTGHDNYITGFSYSPDGKTIATASTDGTARLWDVDTGEHRKILVRHTKNINEPIRIKPPIFSPDGKTIAACSKDDVLWLWDAHTGNNIKTLQGEPSGIVRSFDFSPDSQLLATNNKDGSILIMNVRTGQHITILDGSGYDMVFSPDSKTLTTYFENAALLWNPITGELIKHIHSPQAFMTTVLHLHNKPFAITSYKDETASLWDITTGDHITKFKLPDNINTVFRLLYPGAASVIDYDIACSPTGKTFAISDINKPVRLWDVEKGELIGIPIKHLKDENGPTVLKYSPDGKTLATIPVGSGSNAGGTVRLWNASTGRHLKTLRGYSNCEFNSVAFSPDSKTIATGHKDGTVLLWDIPAH